jgi:hypothetical protein
MKKAFLFIVFLFVAANSFAQSTVYVQGYTRSNGTYVQDHYRTAPSSKNYGSSTRIAEYNFNTPVCIYRNRTNSPSGSYSSRVYTNPTHKSPSSESFSTNTSVYTGSRGGSYYINSNGNKTYIN